MSSPKREGSPTKTETPKSPRGSAHTNVPKNPPLEEDDPDGTQPIFIYGGPFIKDVKPSKFLDTTTPVNVALQGTFRRSFAYHTLKERLPIILTKIIDYCSREANTIKTSGVTDPDLQSFVQYVSKLKNELVTNKDYSEFTAGNPELKKWNEWMQSCDPQNYFGNSLLWTECYVYRRLWEACELYPSLNNFDYFQEAKQGGFNTNIEPMCVIAERMVESMLGKSDRPKRKEDFVTLLKICMWSNRCDMSITAGGPAPFSSKPPPPPPNQPPPAPPKGKKKAAGPPPPPPDPGYVDPFLMITNNKDYLLVDDAGKAFETLTKKAEALTTKIANNTTFKQKCSCDRLAKLAGWPKKERPEDMPLPEPVEGEEPQKIPCPAKMVIPQSVIFDIVCDNAGYELFTDLCFAHFLIAQEMVQKIRFHVKKYPWFVSDVTTRDFRYVIDACKSASFSRSVDPPGEAPPAEGETPSPKVITSEALRTLGAQWDQYLQDGTFLLMAEDYWTYPHPFKDMKRFDPTLYRKLQFAVMILFKGDLNYRKLLADRNVVTIQALEPSMQGFIPAPIVAARTVKSEVICGLPKPKGKKAADQPSKSEQLKALDELWMTRGYWAVIQVCPKTEPFKPAVNPCIDYGTTCFSGTCPIHTDI